MKFYFLIYVLLVLSCQSKATLLTDQNEANRESNQQANQESNQQANQKANQQESKKWLFIGDSLTAGFGLDLDQSFVALLAQRMKSQGLDWVVKNAGVSGDTSAGVLRRLDWLLDAQVKRVFLCIGANDGLRGQDTEALYENLTKIVKTLKERKIEVILAGMKMPPNYGVEYQQKFESAYQRVASEQQLIFMPFLLDGVAGIADLNLPDGIHPNIQGQIKMADTVESFLKSQNLLSKDQP